MYDHTDLGVDLIRAERERQITDEGYTPEHDRAHSHSDLLDAALAYVKVQPELWPWDPASFKPAHTEPHDVCDDACIRDLVKAGALIAAAIDRLIDDQDENASSLSLAELAARAHSRSDTDPSWRTNHEKEV